MLHSDGFLYRLKRARENADVIELETVLAEAAAQQLSIAGVTPETDTLIRETEDMYREVFRSCEPYVLPLRRACREMDDKSIFSALLKCQQAPVNIQLSMYSDMRAAAGKRQQLLDAHEHAVSLLDTPQKASDIQSFLRDTASLLPERTVSALLQKSQKSDVEGRILTKSPSMSGQRGPAAKGTRPVWRSPGDYFSESDASSTCTSSSSSFSSPAHRSHSVEDVSPPPRTTMPPAAQRDSVPVQKKSLASSRPPWRQQAEGRSSPLHHLSEEERALRRRIEEAEDEVAVAMFQAALQSLASLMCAAFLLEPSAAEVLPLYRDAEPQDDAEASDRNVDQHPNLLGNQLQHHAETLTATQPWRSSKVKREVAVPHEVAPAAHRDTHREPSKPNPMRGATRSTSSERSLFHDVKASHTLDIRSIRLQARLRAILTEEDISRHDIENSEAFTRTITLFPSSVQQCFPSGLH